MSKFSRLVTGGVDDLPAGEVWCPQSRSDLGGVFIFWVYLFYQTFFLGVIYRRGDMTTANCGPDGFLGGGGGWKGDQKYEGGGIYGGGKPKEGFGGGFFYFIF